MGTNTITTINHGKTRRNFNLVDCIENSTLKSQDKTELLINLTGKRKTMMEGAVLMLKNTKFRFDDFEQALALLNSANDASSLGAVENALQKQIDVIRRMSDVDLTPENKALCLYTLQNMVFALGDFNLGKNQANDFVPKILQDQYQMLMKGTSLNWDLDRLNDSTYSTEYCDSNNPVLAHWKFLDANLIQRNLEEMSQAQAAGDDAVNNKFVAKQELSVPVSTSGTIDWGAFELKPTTDDQINNYLNSALTMFDTTDLKQNLFAIFNFVNKSSSETDQTAVAVNDTLHKIALSSMHKIVEIGNNQQKKNLSSENSLTASKLDLMSFDLGVTGGEQMIFAHQTINDQNYYVLTLGSATKGFEKQNNAMVDAPEQGKKTAKQLLNNLRNLISGFNKNASDKVQSAIVESTVKLHCFKLSPVEDAKYLIEEFVTPQAVSDVVRVFNAAE